MLYGFYEATFFKDAAGVVAILLRSEFDDVHPVEVAHLSGDRVDGLGCTVNTASVNVFQEVHNNIDGLLFGHDAILAGAS